MGMAGNTILLDFYTIKCLKCVLKLVCFEWCFEAVSGFVDVSLRCFSNRGEASLLWSHEIFAEDRLGVP